MAKSLGTGVNRIEHFLVRDVKVVKDGAKKTSGHIVGTSSATSGTNPFLIDESSLQRTNSSLAETVKILAQQVASRISAYCTFMVTLGRDDIEVTNPIPVTIEPDGGGYIASFMDANIASGGDTVQDAFESLQDILASSFCIAEQRSEGELGPRLLREKRILMEFLCRSPKNTPKRQPKS